MKSGIFYIHNFIGAATRATGANSLIPLLIIQDFEPDLLLKSQVEMRANDFLGQPSP